MTWSRCCIFSIILSCVFVLGSFSSLQYLTPYQERHQLVALQCCLTRKLGSRHHYLINIPLSHSFNLIPDNPIFALSYKTRSSRLGSNNLLIWQGVSVTRPGFEPMISQTSSQLARTLKLGLLYCVCTNIVLVNRFSTK